MKESNTSERLKYIINHRGLKQVEILDKCQPFCNNYGIKLTKSDLSQYVSGKVEPKQDKLSILGLALDVSEAWLAGYNVPMSRNDGSDSINHIITDDKDTTSALSNIFPIELKRFPMLGEIACGKPTYANEDRESYVMAGTDIKADFCLKAKGDSMINARILDGDIVFIRKQDMVENGSIAAVIVNDSNEATLKRLFYYHEKSLLILKAENPIYEDMIFQNEELEQVHILGKAIAFQSDVK